MKHNVEFKNFSPTPLLGELVEKSIKRLEHYAPDYLAADATFLRFFIEQNHVRSLYRVSLTAHVPGGKEGRTLAAHVERHDAEEAVREAFDELERQLLKHKEMTKDPAQLRHKKGKAAPESPQ